MKESTPRCEDVADKLSRLFGWRQTYPVQKLQRSILPQTNERVRFMMKFFGRELLKIFVIACIYPVDRCIIFTLSIRGLLFADYNTEKYSQG